MIAVGTIHHALIIAAMMIAAVSLGKWYFGISNFHGAGGLVFVN